MQEHGLLTAVKFATINSVLALILSLKLNQNFHLTKAGNTTKCRRLDHTDIAATHILAVYEVVSCQLSRLNIVRWCHILNTFLDMFPDMI